MHLTYLRSKISLKEISTTLLTCLRLPSHLSSPLSTLTSPAPQTLEEPKLIKPILPLLFLVFFLHWFFNFYAFTSNKSLWYDSIMYEAPVLWRVALQLDPIVHYDNGTGRGVLMILSQQIWYTCILIVALEFIYGSTRFRHSKAKVYFFRFSIYMFMWLFVFLVYSILYVFESFDVIFRFSL